MHLTQLLCTGTRELAKRRFGVRKFPKGNIFAGKHKLIKEVTPLAMAEVRRFYEIEEQNMFYLRHPYIPLEVSTGHVQALYDAGLKEHPIVKIIREKREYWKMGNVTLEERFEHLKSSENWDV